MYSLQGSFLCQSLMWPLWCVTTINLQFLDALWRVFSLSLEYYEDYEDYEDYEVPEHLY